jgi:hypothetical protein
MKMPTRDSEAIRRAALPWYGKAVADAYLRYHGTRYGNDFARFVLEGYRSFVHGTARASMILIGEALARILYAQIAEALQSGPLTVRRGNKSIALNSSSVHNLQDELTFAQAEHALGSHIDSRTQQQVNAVRFLRNRAAHGDLPLLDEWDPDDGKRSETEFHSLLSGRISIPEGYRFYKGGTWVTLAIRDHPCNTLRELSTEERIAVIEQLLVISVIQGFPCQGQQETSM